VLMFRGKMEDNGSLVGLTEQVNPPKIMQHPARRRINSSFTLLVGKRRPMIFQRYTEAVFQGGIH